MTDSMNTTAGQSSDPNHQGIHTCDGRCAIAKVTDEKEQEIKALKAECSRWVERSEEDGKLIYRYRSALQNIQAHMALICQPPEMSAVWNIAERALRGE